MKTLMARHAYETVAVYRDLLLQKEIDINKLNIERDWNKLPVMRKETLATNLDRVISEHYLADYVMGKLVRMHTSGTTGTCMDIYWDKRDYFKSLVPLWLKRWKVAGVHPKDKVCFFSTCVDISKNEIIEKNALIISKTNLTMERLYNIWNKILDFQPTWLLIQPSMASLLCNVVLEDDLPKLPTLKYIELTGEMALTSLKDKLKEVFRCEIGCHYGTMEVSTIGYENDNVYQLFDTSTYLEVLDERGKGVKDGEIGEICVTSLHNHVMPFVRYATGDRGKIIVCKENEKVSRYLYLSKARENDWVSMPDGRKLPPDELLHPIELFNAMYENAILQIQVKQTEWNCLEVHLALDADFSLEEIINFYRQHLSNYWRQQFMLKFILEPQIVLNEKTGKLRWFVNEYLQE